MAWPSVQSLFVSVAAANAGLRSPAKVQLNDMVEVSPSASVNEYQEIVWTYLIDLPTNVFSNEGETPTHNIRASGNDNWRGRRNTDYHGWQLVYDSSGNRVDDARNLGTYDFGPPRYQFFRHVEQDITPWIQWKNSKDDDSTRLERLTALYRSKLYAVSLTWYWKGLYGCLDAPEDFE